MITTVNTCKGRMLISFCAQSSVMPGPRGKTIRRSQRLLHRCRASPCRQGDVGDAEAAPDEHCSFAAVPFSTRPGETRGVPCDVVLPSELLRRSAVCALLCTAATSLHAGQTSRATPRLDELTLEELMNVEVTTASKSREKQSDAPAIVEVLTRDELTRFGGTTLEDVLTRVP